MLDAARQAIRWTIPGWLLFIFLGLFFAAELVARGPGAAKDPLVWVVVTTLVTSQPELLIAVGAAGVPVGFLLYQLYYWGYWRGFEFERVRPLDKGLYVLEGTGIDTREMLGDDLVRLAPEYEAKEQMPYRFRERLGQLFGRGQKSRWRAIVRSLLSINNWIELTPVLRTRESAERYKHNWFVAESVWYHTIVQQGREYLETRAVFMADVYHSLGAARVTLVFAGFCYVVGMFILDLRFRPYLEALMPAGGASEHSLPKIAVLRVVTTSVVSAPIYLMLRSTRRVTRQNLLTLKRHFIIACRNKGATGRS